MKTSHRLAVLADAAAVIAILFVVLRPSDDDEATPTPTTATAETTPGSTTQATAPQPPRPEYVEVRARNLKPVGGVKKIKVSKGDTVRIAVISDQAEEA